MEHDGRKVFLGGLPRTVTERALRDELSRRFGDIERIISLRPLRGFGFALFKIKSSADKAIALHRFEFDGAKVEIKLAVPAGVRSNNSSSDNSHNHHQHRRRSRSRSRSRGYDTPPRRKSHHHHKHSSPPPIRLGPNVRQRSSSPVSQRERSIMTPVAPAVAISSAAGLQPQQSLQQLSWWWNQLAQLQLHFQQQQQQAMAFFPPPSTVQQALARVPYHAAATAAAAVPMMSGDTFHNSAATAVCSMPAAVAAAAPTSALTPATLQGLLDVLKLSPRTS